MGNLSINSDQKRGSQGEKIFFFFLVFILFYRRNKKG